MPFINRKRKAAVEIESVVDTFDTTKKRRLDTDKQREILKKQSALERLRAARAAKTAQVSPEKSTDLPTTASPGSEASSQEPAVISKLSRDERYSLQESELRRSTVIDPEAVDRYFENKTERGREAKKQDQVYQDKNFRRLWTEGLAKGRFDPEFAVRIKPVSEGLFAGKDKSEAKIVKILHKELFGNRANDKCEALRLRKPLSQLARNPIRPDTYANWKNGIPTLFAKMTKAHGGSSAMPDDYAFNWRTNTWEPNEDSNRVYQIDKAPDPSMYGLFGASRRLTVLKSKGLGTEAKQRYCIMKTGQGTRDASRNKKMGLQKSKPSSKSLQQPLPASKRTSQVESNKEIRVSKAFDDSSVKAGITDALTAASYSTTKKYARATMASKSQPEISIPKLASKESQLRAAEPPNRYQLSSKRATSVSKTKITTEPANRYQLKIASKAKPDSIPTTPSKIQKSKGKIRKESGSSEKKFQNVTNTRRKR